MFEFLDYQTRDVMSEKPMTIAPDATLSDLEAIFEANEFNALPVTDSGGAIVGLVTKLDLLRAFVCEDGQIFPPYDEIMNRSVRSVMSREVLYVLPRTPLTRVLNRLVETGWKSMPVLDEDDHLVGMVAREDVMRGLRRAVSGEKMTAPD
jgi:CBS-domain-containing membrane protein